MIDLSPQSAPFQGPARKRVKFNPVSARSCVNQENIARNLLELTQVMEEASANENVSQFKS